MRDTERAASEGKRTSGAPRGDKTGRKTPSLPPFPPSFPSPLPPRFLFPLNLGIRALIYILCAHPHTQPPTRHPLLPFYISFFSSYDATHRTTFPFAHRAPSLFSTSFSPSHHPTSRGPYPPPSSSLIYPHFLPSLPPLRPLSRPPRPPPISTPSWSGAPSSPDG